MHPIGVNRIQRCILYLLKRFCPSDSFCTFFLIVCNNVIHKCWAWPYINSINAIWKRLTQYQSQKIKKQRFYSWLREIMFHASRKNIWTIKYSKCSYRGWGGRRRKEEKNNRDRRTAIWETQWGRRKKYRWEKEAERDKMVWKEGRESCSVRCRVDERV